MPDCNAEPGLLNMRQLNRVQLNKGQLNNLVKFYVVQLTNLFSFHVPSIDFLFNLKSVQYGPCSVIHCSNG